MLTDTIAVVAGASRGGGRGVALALGEAGATVYVTGRTRRGGRPLDGAPGTIDETADEVTARGGRGLAVQVDHTDAAAVARLFDRIRVEHGRVDVLVSAVWGGNERYADPSWKRPFWDAPADVWHECVDAGPRAFWLASREAARLMSARRSGLIVTISEPVLEGAFEEQIPPLAGTFWSLGHAATNRLVGDLSHAAAKSGISVVGLLPGFMKTERVEMHLRALGEEERRRLRYDLAESPEYAGRAVVALAQDPAVLAKAGKLLYVADLAEEYGFTDVDGRRPANFYRELGLVE